MSSPCFCFFFQHKICRSNILIAWFCLRIKTNIHIHLCTDVMLISHRSVTGPMWDTLSCLSVISSLWNAYSRWGAHPAQINTHVYKLCLRTLIDVTHSPSHEKAAHRCTWLIVWTFFIHLPPLQPTWRPEVHSLTLFALRCEGVCVNVILK